MAKNFNITGTCIPEKNYMADVSGKLRQVLALVEAGEYFTINRPRQYGKTTMLFLLTQRLWNSSEYLPAKISFAGVGDEVFLNEKGFCQMFLELLETRMRRRGFEALADLLLEESRKAGALKEMSDSISRFVRASGKKVVLLIDEVDKSSNNQLFVSFLALLRDKYLLQKEGEDDTFYSVVLAGVHDVKSLKLKIRPDAERKYNSPWNISANFKVNMNLEPAEIATMLEDYVQERGVKMNIPAIAERLFFFTSGYPFLVSNLCKIVDEDILPDKNVKEWTLADIDKAFQLMLVQENMTNFDSVKVNLENNPDLFNLTHALIVGGNSYEYHADAPFVELGLTYGIFARSPTGGLAIHNRFYRERIANYMIAKMATEAPSRGGPNFDAYNFRGQFALPDNRLNLELVLLRFQAFMREQYSDKDRDFLERNGRMLFLAFLRPIINGGGYDFKEAQIDDEKRLDVVITYFQHKYIVELKIWRGESYHQKGLQQLAGYLEGQQLTQGYLLIFDHSVHKTWRHEWLEEGGKKVFAAWV